MSVRTGEREASPRVRDVRAGALERIRRSPVPSPRYGLSVFLRKALPDARTVKPACPSRVAVSGGALSHCSLSDLDGRLSRLLERRVADDTSVALHVLHGDRAALLRIPEGQSGSVRLHHLVAPGAFTTLIVQAGTRARLTVEEEMVSSEGNGYGSTLVLLALGEEAEVDWFSVLTGTSGHRALERLTAVQRGGILRHYGAVVGCDSVRESLHVALQGEGASVTAKGLFLAHGGGQYDLAATSEHHSPSTNSDLLMKGIVGGRAQAVYRGLVHVAATAPKSNGYQRVNTLLLSSQAEVDAVPKLEIKTDDVRCTHGATTSHVNPEQLFYLQSRGLSAERAAELVVSGFLQSVVLSYPEAMRSELAHAVASSVAQTLNP